MTAAALLEELNQRGIALSAHGDRLRVESPRGLLTDDLRQVLRENKPELLRWLGEGPGPPAAIDEALRALVARVGDQHLWLQEHGDTLPEAEWERRRDILCANEGRLNRMLRARGLCGASAREALAACGWRVMDAGIWYPALGSPTEREDAVAAAWRRIGAEVPAGAVSWAWQRRPDLRTAVEAAEAAMDAAEGLETTRAAAKALAQAPNVFGAGRSRQGGIRCQDNEQKPFLARPRAIFRGAWGTSKRPTPSNLTRRERNP